MIRVSTKFDYTECKWNIVGKLVLNSKYTSWRRDSYTLDNNYLRSHSAQTHGSPILAPTCLSTWSK